MGFRDVVKGAINHSITEVVDIDGVVRQIDFNRVLQKIDVNQVVSRIDFNEVLSTIDWDAQLERIDFDAVVRRLDTTSIIARSSTGIFSSFLDSLRTTVVLMDLYLWVVSRCKIWCQHHRQKCYLPPMPSLRRDYRQRNDRQVYPKGRTNKAVAVQGRFCGFVSKAIAVGIDILLITLLFGMLFQLIDWCMVIFLKKSHDEAGESTSTFKSQQSRWMLFLYGCYWFAYFFLSIALAGQTFGMVLVGVRVVNCNPYQRTITPSVMQAFLRTCLLPLTLTFCWPLAVVGLHRRDGRMVHDLFAKTGMIYLWDAKMAKVRQQFLHDENGMSTALPGTDYDDSDPIDDIIEQDEDDNDAETGVVLGQEDERQSLLDGESSYQSFDRRRRGS